MVFANDPVFRAEPQHVIDHTTAYLALNLKLDTDTLCGFCEKTADGSSATLHINGQLMRGRS